MAVGIGAMGLNVVLSLAFIGAFQAMGWMALGGLALSNSLATTAEMAVLLAIVRQRLHGLEGRRLAASLARIVCAAVAMGGVAWAVALLLRGASVWLTASLAVAAGVAVYAASTMFMGSTEPRAVRALVRRGRQSQDR